MSSGKILMVPKNGQGHLLPCMELCKHLILQNFHITLLLDSDFISSIPLSLLQSPFFQVHKISSVETFLTTRRDPDSTQTVCAVIDHIMHNTQQVFWKFGIPTVTFITSGACWAALQHAAWVVRPADMRPGEIRALPGLPEDMTLSYSDLNQRRHWLPQSLSRNSGPPGGLKMPRGPPLPGEPAPWVEEVQNASAILINTCDDLERPFLDYVANLTHKPVWGVGPLLPEKYWKSTDTVVLDKEIRPKRDYHYNEDDIIEWLDSKPRGSVIYVSFGSEVGPTMEEYGELANALEETKWAFIWVIQKQHGEGNYYPRGLDDKVGKRGLIIYGWAPQLLILSHPSTGGFVSHCGWNSTVEAMVGGIPILTWPIRGDQYYNAKLVVNHLKAGTNICESYPADMVKKVDIIQGIEKLLTDDGIRQAAASVSVKFKDGFPATSLASLNAFSDFIKMQTRPV